MRIISIQTTLLLLLRHRMCIRGIRATKISNFYFASIVHRFFVPRRSRHTSWPRDWSSDVCSSDLIGAGAFPEAIIIATKTFENQPHKQEIIDEINHFDHMYYLTRPYPVIYPNVNLIIDNNGINLQLGDLTYVFYLSPGHTNDGLFFYIKNLKTLVAGDYLSNIEIPFITSSYTDYLNTVLLMEKVMDTNEVE